MQKIFPVEEILMATKYRKYGHCLCRPTADARDVLRLNHDGTWTADDGKPALAFSGKSSNNTHPGNCWLRQRISGKSGNPCGTMVDGKPRSTRNPWMHFASSGINSWVCRTKGRD